MHGDSEVSAKRSVWEKRLFIIDEMWIDWIVRNPTAFQTDVREKVDVLLLSASHILKENITGGFQKKDEDRGSPQREPSGWERGPEKKSLGIESQWRPGAL